jgi:hypothetical protein
MMMTDSGFDPTRIVRLAPDYFLRKLTQYRSLNSYERVDGRWIVAAGPVTDTQRIAICETQEEADFIVGALGFLFETNGEIHKSSTQKGSDNA